MPKIMNKELLLTMLNDYYKYAKDKDLMLNVNNERLRIYNYEKKGFLHVHENDLPATNDTLSALVYKSRSVNNKKKFFDYICSEVFKCQRNGIKVDLQCITKIEENNNELIN